MATEDWILEPISEQLENAGTIRTYLICFSHDMTTAELIGAFRKLVDTGVSTDAEERALLDLLAPLA